MAIAELFDHEIPLDADEVTDLDGGLHLAIHDGSRLEWSLAVPLPDAEAVEHTLSAELLVPANLYVGHSPWQQLQMFTRLDGDATSRRGPNLPNVEADVQNIDALRREALARAGKLANASRSFARHCRLAASLFAMAPHSDLDDTLGIWLETADALVFEARNPSSASVRAASREPAQLVKERDLADEYVSVRYVELLAAAERSLSAMLDSRSPHTADLTPVVERIQGDVADRLERELDYRRGRCWTNVDEGIGPEMLERYLDRASALKKHFQEVLFLDTEHRKPAEKIQVWARVFATLLAGAFAFILQLAISKHANVGEGLTALAVVAGLCYAARDRFKESGREWLAEKMARHYAHRVTLYRLPSRRSHRREVIATARESLDEKKTKVVDPLNPACGASVPVTSIQYKQRGMTRPQPTLRAQGVQRVKHVFRYDLSPLFARLDDPVKQVPVLTRGSRRVSFTDAPRCYRVEVQLRLTLGAQSFEERRILVLSKRGLERLERVERIDRIS